MGNDSNTATGLLRALRERLRVTAGCVEDQWILQDTVQVLDAVLGDPDRPTNDSGSWRAGSTTVEVDAMGNDTNTARERLNRIAELIDTWELDEDADVRLSDSWVLRQIGVLVPPRGSVCTCGHAPYDHTIVASYCDGGTQCPCNVFTASAAGQREARHG